MEVHQLLSNMDGGDAISNEALELRDILRLNGYESEIYARFIHPGVSSECRFYKEHRKRSSARNIAILHHSIGSEVSEYFRGLPDRKIMIYHNITPSAYFEPFDSRHAYLLKKGRYELKTFAAVPDLALGDSDYNAEELRSLGYGNVAVLPLPINTRHFDAEPEAAVMGRYKDQLTNIIFVGRVAPNKRFEDVIKAFSFYQRFINPSSRLFLVGSYRETDRYFTALKALAENLGARDVIFTGHVTKEELAAYYRLAHIFLCMSEHEGFCVPLLEAMHLNIPVLAYRASAVPETMGYAGVLFSEKRYEEIAELMDAVLTNPALKSRILSAQSERLKDFDRVKTGERFIEYVRSVAGLDGLTSSERRSSRP
ncbi:MAG: glycosyltransferase [Deltaproteobacteria bacterium]|nr:glycosyltransferase [Deltaproteobacteria bacterium]